MQTESSKPNQLKLQQSQRVCNNQANGFITKGEVAREYGWVVRPGGSRLALAVMALMLCVLTACGNRAAASPPGQTQDGESQAGQPQAHIMSTEETPRATVTPTATVAPAAESAAKPDGRVAVNDALDNESEMMQAQRLATVVARAAKRTQMGFLIPARMAPTATPAPENGSQASEQNSLSQAQSPLERPAASASGLHGSMDSFLRTPTPRPTPRPIVELLNLPLPESPAETTEEPVSETQQGTQAGDAAPVQVAVPDPAPPPAPTPVWSHESDGEIRTVRVPILMYHYLSVPPPGADIYRVDLSVTPERFAAHLDALQANGYSTISLYQLHAHLTQGAPLPEKPVILTFDDGYRDNYEYALPLLRARGMTATFFIVTDFINEGFPAYLTWDMVREMYAAGMSIEAHGRNHTSLKNRDIDYLVWQALGNLEAIEAEVGTRPRFIAYPAGEYDQLTIELFASAHYWGGVTTVQGATHSTDRLFELRRVRVRHTTTPEELLRLVALDW